MSKRVTRGRSEYLTESHSTGKLYNLWLIENDRDGPHGLFPTRGLALGYVRAYLGYEVPWEIDEVVGGQSLCYQEAEGEPFWTCDKVPFNPIAPEGNSNVSL